MSPSQTKGQLEAQIAAAITQFEREHLGRGPQEVRAWIIQDLILVRLKRVLTPAEEKLARDREGYRLVKKVRRQLIEGSRPILDEMVQRLTEVQVVSLHSDISVNTGERIIVFTLAEDLEAKLRR
ncbi:MAG: Na-translocating system protein MpsC family protein [Planctomycetota bacterium]